MCMQYLESHLGTIFAGGEAPKKGIDMQDGQTAWRVRTEKVRNFMNSIGIEAVAFLSPGPYEKLEQFLLDRQWEPERAKQYATPSYLLEDVQCVITALFPYYAGEETGNLSLYCRGRDYHLVIKEYFERLLHFLKQEITEVEIHARVCVDTGPVIDRYFAMRGGLAEAGRNNLLYRRGMGSYFFIGSMLVNLPFLIEEAKPQMAAACRKCERCIRSCPGGALKKDGTFDLQRCRSAITQKKGELDDWELTILEKDSLIFGCDVCQRVCPMNQHLLPTALPEFREDRIVTVSKAELEGLSERQFREVYGDRAFAWRGKKVLLRNLYINGEEK